MTAADLVKAFEGCVLTAYRDIAGIWTIGFGHTGKDVHEGLVWTQDQADATLEHDLAEAASLLEMYSPGTPLGAQQALIDFIFNLGGANYRNSTLRQLVNAGNWTAAKVEILKWDHSGGNVIPGLLRRRQAEAALM
jgi:lysozyme